eukprot:3013979-Prymnesium_polylepis.1
MAGERSSSTTGPLAPSLGDQGICVLDALDSLSVALNSPRRRRVADDAVDDSEITDASGELGMDCVVEACHVPRHGSASQSALPGLAGGAAPAPMASPAAALARSSSGGSFVCHDDGARFRDGVPVPQQHTMPPKGMMEPIKAKAKAALDSTQTKLKWVLRSSPEKEKSKMPKELSGVAGDGEAFKVSQALLRQEGQRAGDLGGGVGGARGQLGRSRLDRPCGDRGGEQLGQHAPAG